MQLTTESLGWPQTWAIYQDLPNQPFGYPISGAPFARGATGTVTDRRGGRDLPLFWNEVDLRGFRVLSRFLWDTNEFMIGFGSTLVNYNVRKGFTWQACLKGAKKTPYATNEAGADPLVAKAQSLLDQFRSAPCGEGVKTSWPLQSREAFRRWRRDGEVFGRFFAGGYQRLPVFRFVEPEQVGDPQGRTDGPFSFGLEKPEGDQSGPTLAVHLWDMDSGGTTGEWHDFEPFIHIRANVDSSIKRGLPDTFPVQDKLEGIRKLLRNMLGTATDQAAVAWIEQFPTALVDQVRGLVPQVTTSPGQTTPATSLFPGPVGSMLWPWMSGNGQRAPGTVLRVEGNRGFTPAPVATGISGYVEVEQACLRAVGARWGMPEYFSGNAQNNNFASTLVVGSPFTVSVESSQEEFQGSWEQACANKVIDYCVEAGLLTASERARLDVEIEAPAVVTADPEKEVTGVATQIEKKIMCLDTARLKLGLDPQHESEGVKKDQAAFPPMPPGQAPGQDGDATQEWTEETISFDEDKHPRDENGRFISHGEIESARSDKSKASKLLDSIKDPEERKKLESMLTAPAKAKVAPPSKELTALVADLEPMVKRAYDPHAVSDEEVEAAMARVAKLPEVEQKQLAKILNGKAGKNAADAQRRIRAELTAGKRLLESQNV